MLLLSGIGEIDTGIEPSPLEPLKEIFKKLMEHRKVPEMLGEVRNSLCL